MDNIITIEKLDTLKNRLGVSYQEAREALEIAGGDVVEALIYLENRSNGQKQFQMDGAKWWEQVKGWIREGNVTRIRLLNKERELLFEIPVTLGALGVAGAILSVHLAIFAGIGAMAAVAAGCKVEVERKDGTREWIDIDKD